MLLKELIDQYETTDQVIDLIRATRITLLVGISGAGKDTIKNELLKSADFHDIVSHTTRAPRTNDGVPETDGAEYHFISESAAHEMLLDHQFIEAKFVHGTLYGTSLKELQEAHDQNRIAITSLDVQGVAEYKAISQDVVAVFILPPTYAIWRERLARRYESPEAFTAEWKKRRESAIRELTHALEVPYYHFIVNDSLERAVHVTGEIAHQPDVFHRKDDEARLQARDLLAAIKASV
jgi:guanylate kinase